MKTRDIALYGILMAIIVLMNFTPLGYLKIGTVEITFLMIPVAVGAIMLGPVGGAVLGGVFGLTSFFQCFGMSPFGVALFSINPIAMAFTCIVTRILMGFLSGLIFKGLKKVVKKGIAPFLVSTVSAAVLNTLFFVSSVLIFFGNSDYIKSFGNGLVEIIGVFITVNAVIEIIVCTIVGSAISKTLSVIFEKRRV